MMAEKRMSGIGLSGRGLDLVGERVDEKRKQKEVSSG
jgi:hypothetical protein